MFEDWNLIPNTGGLYEASSLGRIRSKDRTIVKLNRWGQLAPIRIKGRNLKPWLDANGYGAVYVCFDGQRIARNVHRMICEAFHGPPQDRHVNHRDGDKGNDRPSNLEWCTPAENMAHARDTGLLNDRHAVIATPLIGGGPLRFVSINAASRAFGCGAGNIWKAVNGQLKQSKGFVWTRAA